MLGARDSGITSQAANARPKIAPHHMASAPLSTFVAKSFTACVSSKRLGVCGHALQEISHRAPAARESVDKLPSNYPLPTLR